MADRKLEQIGIHAASIPGSRFLIAIPSMNPSLGPTLEVIAFPQQGYGLTLTDPAGEEVWSVMLNAEGGVNGPGFGRREENDSNG